MTELTDLQRQLRSATNTLERMVGSIEPVFLEAGNHLSVSVGHLGDLTRGFSAMAGRLENSDTVAAISALRQISDRIATLGDGTQASEKRLDEMHDRATALDNRIIRLSKAIGEVKVLGINAKIEAAHVTAANVDFTVFTREIGRLADLASDQLGQLAKELADLLVIIHGARAGLAAFSRDHRQSLVSVSSRLGQGLAAMSARSRDSAMAIHVLADVSRHMAGEVAQVVEGLQVGDIVRQRGEHVVEAVRTLMEVLSSADLPVEHRQMLAASVCRLQAAQAGEAASDLRGETARIEDNLYALCSNLANLPRRCVSVYAASDDSSSSFLAELGQELHDAYGMLHRYTQARAEVETVVTRVSSMISGMFHHIHVIHSIEADMRVMGLNATFKCARLGPEGFALSVIAQELRSYSNRTADDGNAIMADLRGLMDAAREMDATERQGQESQDIESEMANAVGILERVGDDLTHDMSALASKCHAVTQELQHTIKLFDAHPEFVDCLTEYSYALQAAAGTEEVELGMLDCIREEVLAVLRGRYTMASERKIHELFGGGDADETKPPAEADDFLF